MTITSSSRAHSPVQSEEAQGQVSVRPLAVHIGAEIGGIDLAEPQDDATIAVVRAALLRHRVVFFRGQSLDHDAQIAFARRFGDLTHAHPHEDAPPEGHPEILTVDPRKYEQRYGQSYTEQQSRRQYTYYAGWHTDVTAAVNPPAASLLRAETVPEFGGDTTWTNLVAAYEGLSEPLRQFADGLRAEHRFLAGYQPSGNDDQLLKRVNDNLLVSVHPVVRVHPETGERALFVNPGFTSRIVGVSTQESRRLLDLFFDHLIRPEYTVRFHWEPGSVAFWDNRATAHLGPQDLDYVDVDRVLHRVTLIGDRPVGPDGFVSEIVAGREFRSDAQVAA